MKLFRTRQRLSLNIQGISFLMIDLIDFHCLGILLIKRVDDTERYACWEFFLSILNDSIIFSLNI